MSFPVSYDYHRTVKRIYDAQPKPKSVSYKVPVPFMPFSIPVTVTVDDVETDFIYTISIGHSNTITSIIVCLVGALFFSNFTISQFLIFSGIFCTVIYAVINKFCLDYTLKHLNLPKKNNEPVVYTQQDEWLNDQSKCPACGHDILQNERKCQSCGLTLR